MHKFQRNYSILLQPVLLFIVINYVMGVLHRENKIYIVCWYLWLQWGSWNLFPVDRREPLYLTASYNQVMSRVLKWAMPGNQNFGSSPGALRWELSTSISYQKMSSRRTKYLKGRGCKINSQIDRQTDRQSYQKEDTPLNPGNLWASLIKWSWCWLTQTEYVVHDTGDL